MLAGLVWLSLRSCDIGDEGVAALAAADGRRLARLALYDNRITDAGVVALARSPHLRPARLELAGNPWGDDAARALADSDGMAELAALTASATRLTAAGARALLTSPKLPRLRRVPLLDRILEDDPAGEFGDRFDFSDGPI